MRLVFCSLIVTVSIVISCSSHKDKTVEKGKPISVVGKWYRFTMANGYTEFDIDSQYVTFYNQKVGRFKLPYKIKDDSLKYLTNQYAASIYHFGDSIYLQGNDSTTATLYKFDESNLPFRRIPEEQDSSFSSYLKGFDERLVAEFAKAGIKISNAAEKTKNATYEELLKGKDRH